MLHKQNMLDSFYFS